MSSLADRPAFVANAYGVTRDGRAMPGKYLRMEGELIVLQSPNGAEYTFRPENVLSVEECEEQLRAWRVDRVASGYKFEVMRVDRSGMVIRCFNPEHPVRSNYVMTIGNSRETCSCPDFQKRGEHGYECKHLKGFHIQRDRQQAVRPTIAAQTKTRPTYTAEEW